MKFNTCLIVWHNKEPVYSIDFHPTSNRFATAGADKTVKVWRWTVDGEIALEFVSTLQRHNSAVNIVRFSPNGELLASGGDDGMVFLWKLNPDAPLPVPSGLPDEDETLLNKETWTCVHACINNKDIYSLDWSPDSSGIIVGSIDTTVSVWNVSNANGPRKVQEIRDHTHYVQGVAWDPQNKFLLSQSMDRSLRIYRRRARKGVPVSTGNYFCCAEVKKRLGEGTMKKMPKKTASSLSSSLANVDQKPIIIDEPSVSVESAPPSTAPEQAPPIPIPEEPFVHKLFLDESVSSFFRRLCWSPCGNFFFAPTGTFAKNATSDAVDCTYIFSRDCMTKPMAFIPCPSKPSIIVRCNPVLFQLRDIGATAPLLNLTYRIVFAVATVDSVLVYDTQHVAPILVLRDIHYASISDLAWSPDGFRLAISSTDGFCSFTKFETEELGTPLPQPELEVALQKAIEARVRANRAVDSSVGDEVNGSVNKSIEDALDLEDEEGNVHRAKRKDGPAIDPAMASPAKVSKIDADPASNASFSSFSAIALPMVSASSSKKRINPTIIASIPTLAPQSASQSKSDS